MTRPAYGVPVTLFLAVAILAVYAAELGGAVDPLTAGFVPAAPTFQGAAMSVFLHDPGSVAHVAGNLVFLFLFGFIVEPAIGSLRFTSLYLASGAAGVALHWCVDLTSTHTLVGASGAIFGVMALAAVIQPRLLGFAIGFMLLNVWLAFHGGEGVSFGCHTGGFLVGVVVAALLKLQGELEAA